MLDDIFIVFERDPAANNIFDILFYPGVWAIYIHRVAHFFWWLRIPILPRLISSFVRFLTNIDIHPGAKIGKSFFIDHGAGVVIGETTIIGNEVTIFQGVTLGGTGKEHGKRHPTVGSNVVIGAGAIVLGSIKIGDCTKIGAGAVVTKEVPPCSTVVGNPARIVVRDGKKVINQLDHVHMPDPVEREFHALRQRIKKLEEIIEKK